MPFLDGTGPGGLGPMTGRGAGYCIGNAFTGANRPFLGVGMYFFNRGTGYGIGRGRGRGGGWRCLGRSDRMVAGKKYSVFSGRR